MRLACATVLFDCDGVLVDSDASVARAAGVGGVVGMGPRAGELDVDARVGDLRSLHIDAAGVLVPSPPEPA